MRQAELGAAALEVRAGKIDFAQFERITRERWNWWATKLASRYRLPSWYGRDDVRQDLLVWAWEAIARYDAKRSENIGRYVEFSATKRTAKRITKAQGVEQHRRAGIANREQPAVDELPDMAAEEQDMDREMVRGQRFAVLLGLCDTQMERYAIEAIREFPGSLDLAAEALHADPFARRVLKLTSARHAAKRIVQVVEALEQRYGDEVVTEEEVQEEAQAS